MQCVPAVNGERSQVSMLLELPSSGLDLLDAADFLLLLGCVFRFVFWAFMWTVFACARERVLIQGKSNSA